MRNQNESRMRSGLIGLRPGTGPRRKLRLALARHRRPITVLLLLAAVWVTIRWAAPPPEPTVDVTLAKHDLPAGSVVRAGDLESARWPARIAPAARVTGAQTIGRTLATGVSAGEAITIPRLLGPGLLAGQPPDQVAVTIRVADPAALAPIQAGDRVDVLASGTPAADSFAQPEAHRVAASALVLARPTATSSGAQDGTWAEGAFGTGQGAAPGSASSAGVLVLAVDAQTASRLAGAGSSQPLSITLLADP
jgi:Flp pilus assembly protein CpaB